VRLDLGSVAGDAPREPDLGCCLDVDEQAPEVGVGSGARPAPFRDEHVAGREVVPVGEGLGVPVVALPPAGHSARQGHEDLLEHPWLQIGGQSAPSVVHLVQTEQRDVGPRAAQRLDQGAGEGGLARARRAVDAEQPGATESGRPRVDQRDDPLDVVGIGVHDAHRVSVSAPVA